MHIRRFAGQLSILFIIASGAQAANWPEHPQLRAVRATSPIAIDGDLSDAAWQSAPEFTDFTQHDPNDAQPATLRTSIRILYDDEAIYFGAKADDPAKPTALLVRRDTFTDTDFLSINLDPQLDRLSGNAFTITPANVQMDSVLFNDIGEDGSWDGVWASGAKIVPGGWTAEVRIPFSQLRFPDRLQQVWGVNITRRTVRTNEFARIVNTRKGETGFVSHFADIVGLDGIKRGRSLELVPYGVARTDVLTRADRSDPLLDTREGRLDGGLDVKYALTPRLTLTGTLNPDFGQVEVDPAVVNLSAFETFYPEKRPFFTEGVDIFRFGSSPAPSRFGFINSPQVFYSRRIGRSPQGSPDAEYVDAPHETTILGAAKVTGQLGHGWSMGVLDALTDSERARFISNGLPGRQQVEPMTNYFVSRAAKTIGGGSRVGLLLSSVDRRLPDELTALRRSSLTAGVDGYTSFKNKSWILEGEMLGSRVAGTDRAIALTQRSSAHYYQRPDAGHVTLDPSRTSLNGWGGRAMLSKATGVWRPVIQTQAYSPGFETNDAGYMQRTDLISTSAVMQYSNQVPSKHIRETFAWGGLWQNRNFDGDTLERGYIGQMRVTTQAYRSYNAEIIVVPGAFSDRQTRGGPVVRTPRTIAIEGGAASDSRKKFFAEMYTRIERSSDGSFSRSLEVELNARPSSNLLLSIEPSFNRSHDAAQYLTAFADQTATGTYGRRYVFANLDQHTFEIGTRADWTLRSTLSFQLYLQPFIASGDYHHTTSLLTARTRDYTPYDPSIGDPDFNFRSVRGSAVMRWEFRPGSALYFAWNENREDVVPIGNFRLGRDLRAIPTAPSHDVFMVKLSYWLPM